MNFRRFALILALPVTVTDHACETSFVVLLIVEGIVLTEVPEFRAARNGCLIQESVQVVAVCVLGGVSFQVLPAITPRLEIRFLLVLELVSTNLGLQSSHTFHVML